MKPLVALLIAFMLMACAGPSPPPAIPDPPQVAVSQAWGELSRRGLDAPDLDEIDQEKVLFEFAALTDPSGKLSRHLSFSSRPNFLSAVSGERFDELEKLVPLVGKPGDASRWHIYGAWINAVARSFDGRASFYPPSRQEAVSSMVTASEEGVGITLASQPGGGVVIQSVNDKGPAARLGVEPGQRLLAIGENGKWKDVQSSSPYEAHAFLRGEPGTMVRLKVSHGGAMDKVVSIRREKWFLDEMRVKVHRHHEIPLLAIPGFYVDIDPMGRWDVSTQKDVAREISRFGNSGEFILDLRGNPGGVLEQALEVGSQFGIAGVAWTVRGREISQESKIDQPIGRLPLAVWVDDRTGSSAEILAGALQSRGVLVVGVNTFGKTSLQLLAPLDMPSHIKQGQSKTGNLLFTTARISWGDDSLTHVVPNCQVRPGIAEDLDARYFNRMQSCIKERENK